MVDVAAPSIAARATRAPPPTAWPSGRAAGAAEARVSSSCSGGGDLIRTAAADPLVRTAPVRGVVVASEYLTDEFAARARGMTAAYEDYQQLRVLKQPLAGVYLSFFLMLTLMILVGATWMGLYLAKRITRPVQMLAAAADEIGAGHLDHRVEAGDRRRVRLARSTRSTAWPAIWRPAAGGSNGRRSSSSASTRMSRAGAATSRRCSIASPPASSPIDDAGRIRTWNAAASRLLGIDAARRPACRRRPCFGAPELEAAGHLPSTSRARAATTCSRRKWRSRATAANFIWRS